MPVLSWPLVLITGLNPAGLQRKYVKVLYVWIIIKATNACSKNKNC